MRRLSVSLFFRWYCELTAKDMSQQTVARFLQAVKDGGRAGNNCVETQTDNFPAQHVYLANGYQEISHNAASVWYTIDFDRRT